MNGRGARHRIPELTELHQLEAPDWPFQSLFGAGCPAEVVAGFHLPILADLTANVKSCLISGQMTEAGCGKKPENKLFKKACTCYKLTF